MTTKIKTIDSATAHEWLENKEAIIVDVREPSEFQEVHIEGAYLIPLGKIDMHQLPHEAKNKKVIIHCRLGKRGSTACEKLFSEHAKLDVYNLEGGITAWENAGFPVKR